MITEMSRHRKRAEIEAALPHLRFRKIGSLLFVGEDGNEIVEFTANTGLLVFSEGLPPSIVADNRVANTHEIWLHPDGTLHKYLWTATWETLEYGCSQRHYIGPVQDDDVSMDDLVEAIECNILDAEEQAELNEEFWEPF